MTLNQTKRRGVRKNCHVSQATTSHPVFTMERISPADPSLFTFMYSILQLSAWKAAVTLTHPRWVGWRSEDKSAQTEGRHKGNVSRVCYTQVLFEYSHLHHSEVTNDGKSVSM